MAYYVDLFVFVLPVLLCLIGWFRWYRDPRQLEVRRYQELRAGVYRSMALAGRDLLIVGCLGAYASWRAEPWWVWAAFAVFMFLLGAFALVAAAYAHFGKVPPPEVPPFDPARMDRLLVRGRKRVLQRACFLVLWTYSWHHLLLGPGS